MRVPYESDREIYNVGRRVGRKITDPESNVLPFPSPHATPKAEVQDSMSTYFMCVLPRKILSLEDLMSLWVSVKKATYVLEDYAKCVADHQMSFPFPAPRTPQNYTENTTMSIRPVWTRKGISYN